MEITAKSNNEVHLIFNKLSVCKICGSSSLDVSGQITEFNDFFRDHYFDDLKGTETLACTECGFLSVSPEVQMTKDVLTRLYNIEYFRSNGEIKKSLRKEVFSKVGGKESRQIFKRIKIVRYWLWCR
jgi:hypothetical protein